MMDLKETASALVLYSRVPFLRTVDLVDFWNFHEICFTGNSIVTRMHIDYNNNVL